MASVNRYLAGDTNIVKAPIRGQTTIESGDLLWIHNDGVIDNPIADRADDYYVYPMSDLTTSSSGLKRVNMVKDGRFFGIAMDNSDSGTTEDIAAATSGMFRYPMMSVANAVLTSSVTVGMKVSCSSYPRNQFVQPVSATPQPGASAYIGFCTKTESGASFVDFFLRTDFGPADIVT